MKTEPEKEGLSLVEKNMVLAIEQGEGQYVEFKSGYEGKRERKRPRPTKDVLRDVAETLIAFANAEGGTLYVSVEDDGTLTGVPHEGEKLEELEAGFVQRILNPENFPAKRPRKVERDGRLVLVFEINYLNGSVFQLKNGKSLKRIEDRNEPYAVERIQADRHDERARRFDREFCFEAAEGDLDWNLIESVAAKIFGKGRTEPGEFLRLRKLAEIGPGRIRYTNACVLLFGQREAVMRFFPKSSLRFIEAEGERLRPGREHNVKRQKEYHDNIFRALEEFWEELLYFFAKGENFDDGQTFKAERVLSEDALRECLVNALAHRCYLTPADVKIYRFDHAVEFVNPGGLPRGTDPGSLYRERFQPTRNVLVARILREAGVMRELGEGLMRIKEEMKKRNAVPVFSFLENSFGISLTLGENSEKQGMENALNAILAALETRNFPLAKEALGDLVGKGFWGCRPDNLNATTKEKMNRIQLESAGIPSLYAERQAVLKWRQGI